MASKALKLRIKAEESKRLENGCNKQESVANENDTNATNAQPCFAPSNQSLLEVPPEKAILSTFPPGCPVLFTDTQVTPPLVLGGAVAAVYVNLAHQTEYLYKLLLQHDSNPIVAREEELQWAPQCPVWVIPLQATPDQQWKRALVLGSYLAMGEKTPQVSYSVQQVGTSNDIFHGITKDRIRYRSTISQVAPPAQMAHPQVAFLPNKKQEAMPVLATSVSLPISSSNHAYVGSSMRVLAQVKSNGELSRGTASPRKRPLAKANYVSTIAHTPDDDQDMGRCTAEYKVPYWMKKTFFTDEFIQQACQSCQACTGCRLVILKVPFQKGKKVTSSDASPSQAKGKEAAPVTSHASRLSVFVYGREAHSVDQACVLVGDLLKEYVKEKYKKQLSEELVNGWSKTTYDENGEARVQPAAFVEKREKSDSPTKHGEQEGPPNKKARTLRSPSSEEEGEIVESAAKSTQLRLAKEKKHGTETLQADAGSTSSTVVPKQRTVSEDTAEEEMPAVRENQIKMEGATKSSLHALATGQDAYQDPTARMVAVQPQEPTTTRVETVQSNELAARVETAPQQQVKSDSLYMQGPLTRIIRVPAFANKHYVQDALIGEQEWGRQQCFHETGCDIRLNFPEDPNALDGISVALSGNVTEGDFDYAQEWVENRIVSTVPDEQKGRMLFYLAKDNGYGGASGKGEARCQRSPHDFSTWVWMSVVELPPGFERLHGLFIDTGGKSVRAIVRKTGSNVHLNKGHVFIEGPNPDSVHQAIEAVTARVIWSLRKANEGKKKKNKKKKQKW